MRLIWNSLVWSRRIRGLNLAASVFRLIDLNLIWLARSWAATSISAPGLRGLEHLELCCGARALEKTKLFETSSVLSYRDPMAAALVNSGRRD